MNLLDSFNHLYNSITPFQAAISLSILFLYILHLFLRDLDVPPGPTGSLLFGYWPFLNTDRCHLQLKKLASKYGDVFSLRGAGGLFIHLGSIKALREAHLTKAEYFEGRQTGYGILSCIFKDGVALINGEPWKILRKFFLLKFKEYGLNTVKENAPVYDTMKDTVEELQNAKGRPIKVGELATMKCTKITRRILFNDKGITQEELQEMMDAYGVVASTMTGTNFLLVGNFARFFILPFMPSYWKMKRGKKRIDDVLLKVVERYKSEFDENNISDIVDCYLKERNDRRKRGDPTAAYFTDKALVASLSQFVTDGVLTVGLFIETFISFLVEYPDVQEKVYEEILDIIGPDRLPTMEDKTRLPYTNAFIYEVMRYNDLFPLFTSQQCSKETTICGYKIPEESITLINFHAIHHNPETYENPEEFNPSRFLPTPGKPRPDLPVMFGIGKRSCIGEGFSMNQTFLFVTTVVQNFRLAYPEGSKVSDGKFWSEERVQICFIPRSQK